MSRTYHDCCCQYHCHHSYQIYHSCYHVTCTAVHTLSRILLPLWLLLRPLRLLSVLRVLAQATKAAVLDDQMLEACRVNIKVLQPEAAGKLRLKDERLL